MTPPILAYSFELAGRGGLGAIFVVVGAFASTFGKIVPGVICIAIGVLLLLI